MAERDDKGPMQGPQKTSDVMKAAPGAADPGGATSVADAPSGVQGETPDGGVAEGGTSAVKPDQEDA
jgi:hypothetical protein